MNYSKIQKIISSLLLFVLFFGQITGVSFLGLFSGQAFANNKTYHDLVSIIVDEKTYDELDSEIGRYATDIQNYLENTRVVILPIKKDTTAFQISSLNESLFYEGYKSIKDVDFESRLVGTILIGNFPLPIVSKNGEIIKSIVPFIDFEDKRYIYNPENNFFESNSENLNGLRAEIWEGVISPNTGNFDSNIVEIKNFLDKDHDFYEGKNLFDRTKGILNGKESDGISSDYEPYVFYFDELREQKALDKLSYKGYEAFQNNKEDILYHRYTKDLAKKIKDDIMGEAQDEIESLINKLPATNKLDTSLVRAQAMLIAEGNIDAANALTKDNLLDGLDLSQVNDISTKIIIEKSTKKFIEIFNKGTISDFRKNVHNAGRFNPDKEKVNIDLIPSTITILDFISDRVIKAANNDIEEEIDKIVTGSLAKNITNIPEIIKNTSSNIGSCGSDELEYGNFYFGKKASDLEFASDCTIYRGSNYNSGQLVEANRGLNIGIIQDDSEGNFKDGVGICKTSESAGHKGQGMYGGSSPLNYDTSSIGDFKLYSYDLKKAVLPIFDIKGSKKIEDDSKTPSPNDCLKINWIKTKEKRETNNDGCDCLVDYQILSSPTHCGNYWTCKTENINYNSKPSGDIKGTKIISSYMFHKSPTIKELREELNAKITPNLPIDRDRYVDFFSSEVNAQTKSGKASYKKILYPQLFRLYGKTKEEIVEKLENLLDEKSKEINSIKSGSINLKKFLKEKTVKTIIIKGEEKKFSYFDFLVFSIYWNNLKNTSSKYKFVIENYLSDQVGGNNFDFVLANNKKEYEIAYLGAHGDAQNMYIKMEAEAKGVNPFTDIMSNYAKYNLDILSLGVIQHNNLNDFQEEGDFECAPPEGVPIWEWIPAVICRLKSLLPPKIGIEWVCGEELFDEGEKSFNEEEDLEKIKEDFENDKNICVNDDDKNGINDCLEKRLKKLFLTSDKSRYSFNESGKIISVSQDNDDNRILLDSVSDISFSLQKIIDTNSNKVVFDSSKDNFKDKLNIINEYIYFRPTTVKTSYGSAKLMFSSKNKEADVYIKAELLLKPDSFLTNKIDLTKTGYDYKVKVEDKENLTSGNTDEIKLVSNDLKLQIREEHLFLDTRYVLDNWDFDPADGIIEASNNTNVYIFSGNKNFEDFVNLNKNSIILKLKSFGKDGSIRNINFPITAKIKKKNGVIIQKEEINNLSSLKHLAKINKSGEYILSIEDKYGYNIDFNFEVTHSNLENINIDLGTTLISSESGISSNLVSVYDRFGNLVSGEFLDYKIKILGDSVVFNTTGKKELTFTSIEGYKAFRLKSTGKVGNSKILVEIFKDGIKLKSKSENIRAIKELNLDLSLNSELKVGSKEVVATIIFKDKNGNILNDLNSRVYLSGISDYLEQESAYTKIINGKSIINLKTKSKASQNILMNFRVEGFDDVYPKSIQILPEKPMSISLLPFKTRLEADPKDFTKINVSLRDVYNNIVFTDSSSKINVELRDEYKDLLKIHNNKDEVILNKGEGSFRFDATENPGTIYLKFSSDQTLELNEFIIGTGDKAYTIKGINENAIKLESYFFWKKSKILGKKYNALYTTLLGAEYGDFTQKDYLASGMLFDKNNRSLAVTSLLNSPYNHKDILTITNNGILQKIGYAGDLSQDLTTTLIKDTNNKYYIDLFNSALNIHIGKIYLNFDNLDIKENLYNYIKNENEINFSNFGIKQFTSSIALNSGQLNILLNTSKNNFIFYLDSSAYNLRQIALGNNKKAIAISYNDPFETQYSMNSFSRESFYTYENFEKRGDLGWNSGNKTLLEFASGLSAGEASRKYMGTSVITLGDPVISLKKIQKSSHGITKKYDSTIGKKLNINDIKTYRVFDYNNDSRDDIMTVEDNGFISLLENKSSGKQYFNQKNLARVVDMGNVDFIATGDFSGDSYDDIFFVDTKGKPNLLNNLTKDFVRVDLSENFNLKGRIIAAKSFDMDHDGIDDLIILDESGYLNIFYGNKDTVDFTKKNVYDQYGLKLNDIATNDLGAIYFDGLNSNIDTSKYPLLKKLMFETLTYDLTTDIEKQNYSGTTDFLKSIFAESKNIKISRTFKDINGGYLLSGDLIDVELKIKNTSGHNLKNVVYLENISKYFDINYKSIKSSKELTLRKDLGNFKFYLDKFELNNNEEIIIQYTLKTKPLMYKYIKVGLFEKDEAGDDIYGDIIVKDGPYNCGGDQDIFRSINKRSYQKGIKKQKCEEDNTLPEELAKNDIDKDNNGIPDYLDDLLTSETKRINYAKDALQNFDIDNDVEEDLDMEDLESYEISDFEELENTIEGFNCGFGGNDCFGLPVNWAPLAPGNDPVVMGKLVGDGLKVNEGYPIFSTLTGLQTSCGHSPCCLPSAYPANSRTFVPGPSCGGPGAGGYLGVNSPTNYFRLFVTPTLTGGAGVAACFGAPASVVGNNPPKGLNPVIPGGNCIVYAKKLPNMCEDDVNGEPETIGVINYIDDDTGIINGNCEFSPINKLPATNKIDTKLAREFMEFMKNGNEVNLNEDYEQFLKDVSENKEEITDTNPIEGSNEINIDYDFSEEGMNFSKVEEISNKRTPGFPDFITGWVDDQLEQFITKLADFPILYIIPPEFNNIIKGDYSDYSNKLISNPKNLMQTSGIKEVYNFLGNVPFVNIELEPVTIDIPDLPKTDGILDQYKNQIGQYQNEIQRVVDGAGDAMRPENIIKIQKFQNSIRQNMQAIKSYMEIKDKIADLAGKKEERLGQIMCYIEAIQEMTGGWLSRNGKRFKAWVQTYLLIKAALKSWQALADVFIDYDSECHECKNERHDSLGAQFELVSMIIPKLPVIQFPKWPDIVLDLHQIKMGINLKLPDFKYKKRPIILPALPPLTLPSVSDCINFSIDLPEIPVLPILQIPELPDLPAIPKIILPDLPPPPKLPKMFGALEAILNIMKLITKAMCILKKLPFVPEERAGDQIAFLTEGSGYRPFDFSIKLPAIPKVGDLPFVDEIRVKVLVNLEMDVDFLTEMARAIVEPINNMTNNFSNMFGNIGIDLDFSGVCENTDDEDYLDSLEDVGGGKEYEDNTNYEDTFDTNKIETPSSFRLTPLNLAEAFSTGIQKINKCISNSSKNEISAKEFFAFVNKQLSSDFILKDERLDELRHSFDVVNNYSYSKENKIIEDLQKNNLEKFDTLKSIIKEEIKQTKNYKEEIEKLEYKRFQKISNNSVNKQVLYNNALKKYNDSLKQSIVDLTNPKYFNTNSIKKDGDYLKKRIHKGIENFEKDYLSQNNNKLLTLVGEETETDSSCPEIKSRYKRKYNGIIIVQEEADKKINYKLFDYISELDGKEELESLDFDLDGDKDLLYSMNNNLYLKENIIQNNTKTHLSGIEVLDSSDNKFINGSIFHEAVNDVWESFASNKFINVSFSSSKDKTITNYRLRFYKIIDKFLNVGNDAYIPKNMKEYIIDAISGIGIVNKLEENNGYKTFNNIAYISDIGNNIGKINLRTKKLVNIAESIKNGNIAIIQANKKIYAGNNDVTITYLSDDGKSTKDFEIKAHTNIEFENGIKISKITGNAYIMLDKFINLKGTEIHAYNGLPIDFETRIKILDDNFIANSSSHITIKYYDDSEALIDFRKIKDYFLYDLGAKSNNYGITLNLNNDYYYARMQNFKKNVFGTKTSQVLLSPQKQADMFAPDLDIAKKIRIPVYQEVELDLTNSVYDNSGLENIKEFKIEDLDQTKIKITKTDKKILVKFGKFDKIFKKKINFVVIDENDNKTEQKVEFEVYTPIPKINKITSTGAIIGVINERLTEEPINIYRVRGKLIKRIKTKNTNTRVNTNTGEYLFDAHLIKDDYLSITKDGKEIFKINEYTGKIENLPLLYKTKVFSGKDNFINIGVYDNFSREVFREKINLEKINREVEIVKDFDDTPEDGIFLKWQDSDFDYYRLPKSVLFNPGAFVIYRKSDVNKTALFVIMPDSRVKLINNFYEMQYSYYKNYIKIKLFDKHYNKVIGELLFKINNAFIIR